MRSARSAVSHGSEEEYGLLFDSVVVTQEHCGLILDLEAVKEEGRVDWGGLCSFLMLHLSEKVKNSRSSNVPRWKPPRTLTCPHRDPVQKVRESLSAWRISRRRSRICFQDLNMLPILNMRSFAGCYLCNVVTLTDRRIQNSADWLRFYIIKHCVRRTWRVLGSCSSKWHTSFEINGSRLL